MKTYEKSHSSKKTLNDHIKKIEERGGVVIKKFGVGESWKIEYLFNHKDNWNIGDKFKSNISLGMGSDKTTVFKIEKKDNGIIYKIYFKVDRLERNMLFDENYLSEAFGKGNFVKIK